MPVKDRVKEIREVRAGDLLVNPENFRGHPATQRETLEGVLAEVGNVDVLKVYETDDGLMLLDGHLRRDLLEDETVKVAVLDLTEEEARKVLLTFDRVTTLAEIDPDTLGKLMDAVAVEDAAVVEMLGGWREEFPQLRPGDEMLDPEGEWTGMPEFTNEDIRSFRKITVHFRSHEDAAKFGELIGQRVTEATRSLWYPIEEVATCQDKRYATDEDVHAEAQEAAAS